MKDTLQTLYDTISKRKETPAEGSYTSYLFDKGIDKILKKVGEECSEVIIGAKNLDKDLLCEEICDLTYHVMVLMVEKGISVAEIDAILQKRATKIGNLKKTTVSDKLS